MGNKRQSKNSFRKKSKGKRKGNKRRPNRPSIGRLIASGVKTLLSSVPGAGTTLAAIADFGFKSLGLTTSTSLANSTVINRAETSVTALVARFHIKVSTLIVGSRDVIQIDMDRNVLCQYSDGRVTNITVTAVPTNEASKRQGYWTMSLQPFSTPSDAQTAGFKDPWCPTDQGMKHALMSTTGSASRNLSLSYTPKITDGYSFMFQPLDSAYAEVAIRYFDYNRDSYSNFKASDFNCQLVVSGRVELRVSPTMPPTNNGGYVFSTTVDDKLSSVAMFLQTQHTKSANSAAGANIIGLSTVGFKCEETEDDCVVTGNVLNLKSNLNDDFERIEIDTIE